MESLSDTCELIIQSTKNALEDTPPELAADIVDRGIVLSGGGSLLRNLDILLRERTKLPIIYAENPLSCVALGVGSVLNNLDQWKEYFKSPTSEKKIFYLYFSCFLPLALYNSTKTNKEAIQFWERLSYLLLYLQENYLII